MSERPFMQLYVSDFVGDTLQLSTEHIGAYLLLLIALWNANGTLPADDVKLARVTRLSMKKWRSASNELLPFFIIGEGKLSHYRLSKELQKSERQREFRAAAGAKGGAANALKNKGRRPANATVRLQHTRALPEPYKKEGTRGLVGVDEAASVVLDRIHDEELFVACEEINGQVRAYLQRFAFPREVIVQAKAAMDRPSAHPKGKAYDQ